MIIFWFVFLFIFLFFLWFSFDHFSLPLQLSDKQVLNEEEKNLPQKKKRNETTLKYRVDITTARLDCEWCRFEWRIFSKPKNCDCLVFVALLFSFVRSFVRSLLLSHRLPNSMCMCMCIRTNTRWSFSSNDSLVHALQMFEHILFHDQNCQLGVPRS